jgi:CRISPR-associated endonuclease/helicase Cas3
MSELLAKTPRGEHPITLLKHTRDVMGAAEALFGQAEKPTRLGECWLRFFRIPEVPWAKFHGNLLAACGLHDWGKANDGFQNAVRRCGPQAIRHEHLSALLVAQKSCRDWLISRKDLDPEVILSAVLTHHLKASESAGDERGFAVEVDNGSRFQSLHDHADFPAIVTEVAGRVGLPAALDLSKVPTTWVFAPGGNVETERNQIKRHLHKFGRALSADVPRRRFLHAVRAAQIAADAAGSGLRRTDQSITDWVAGTFDQSKIWDGASVRAKVIKPRTDDVTRVKKLTEFKWNDFQDDCGDPDRVPARSLLLAPCGSGKTLAAWRWIEQQAKGRVGHVLFLYPTRATATEGFRDYVSWAPEADAALMHGTSAFDLDDMFGNPPDGDPRKGRTFAQSETERRLFSLGFWGRRAFSATVDQFLAFLQYGYGPVCMLPVLADSVVVIDEVHSFDNNMFTALKNFLTEFDVPVLCMTATLPNDRRDELVKCGLKVYPDGELPPNLKDVAERKRYRLRRVESRDKAEEAVRAALAAGKRVLWVVNQVKRAHAVVARFVDALPPDLTDAKLTTADGVPVYCYHSRFKLTDRVNRHTALMAALKADKPGPALGITTQVCEMSLDIDVDLLVTEDCPVTALVQRMGRCNRAQSPRSLGSAGDVVVYDPKEKLPYSDGDLTGLAEFLDDVQDRDLSQDDLEKAMKKLPLPHYGDGLVCPFLESGPYAAAPGGFASPPGALVCPFLESGPYAVAGDEQFRDSEEFNRPCVMPGDVGAYLKAGARQPGFVLPVPKKFGRERDPNNPDHAKLSGYLGVARAGHYHAAVGFCDHPLTEWRAD